MLALFALALQFVVSFGHVHADELTSTPLEIAAIEHAVSRKSPRAMPIPTITTTIAISARRCTRWRAPKSGRLRRCQFLTPSPTLSRRLTKASEPQSRAARRSNPAHRQSLETMNPLAAHGRLGLR